MPNHLFAVTGNPVLHSKSPFIFNELFQKMNIDAFYTRLAASDAAEAVGLFKNLGLSGMNVTSPFKEEIMQYLDQVSEESKIIGGVNTIVSSDGKLCGHNTDYIGVYISFLNQGIALEGQEAVVVGAGGAGKAAAYGLLRNNARVTIVNRTLSRAKEASLKLGCEYAGLDDLEALLKKSTIVVSSLSGNADVIDSSWLTGGHIVFDADYKSSKLLVKAAGKGCTIIKGESWLLNQALPAFELFLKIKPADIITDKILDNNLKNHKKNILLLMDNELIKKLNFKSLSVKLNYEMTSIDEMKPDAKNKIFTSNLESFNAMQKDMLKNTLVIFIYSNKHGFGKFNESINNLHLILNAESKTEIEINDKIIFEFEKI